MLLVILLTLSTLAAVGVTLQVCAVQGLGMIWVLPVTFLGAFLAQAAVLFLVIWISCTLMKINISGLWSSRSAMWRFLF